MMMSNRPKKSTLELIGVGKASLRFDETSFAHLRSEFHVEDIATFIPGMRGRGIRVSGLLEGATVPARADHVTFFSGDKEYSVSVTLEQAKKFGILVYQMDGEPLSHTKGGPFRLVTPGLGDLCANVKHVQRIEVTEGPGHDTRPEERSC